MMWTIKNIKKTNQRHICAFDELDGGRMFSWNKSFKTKNYVLLTQKHYGVWWH